MTKQDADGGEYIIWGSIKKKNCTPKMPAVLAVFRTVALFFVQKLPIIYVLG